MVTFIALVEKELKRFLSMSVQTILGPVTTALLYQLIFGHQLKDVVIGFTNNVSYIDFLIPGLIMMQVLLNSFGNSSSTLIQSKYTGSIVYILMAPMTPFSMYNAYLLSSIIRGIVVGMAVFIAIFWFGHFMISNLLWIIYFLIMGASITAGLGIIAGILCQKFDQLAGFQSFVIVPMIYLSGIFFNTENLDGIWRHLMSYNPFMYIVRGFRAGFIGNITNIDIYFAMLFVLFVALSINLFGYLLLKKGIRIKN
jgi:ABC-2 type transport system permease protein